MSDQSMLEIAEPPKLVRSPMVSELNGMPTKMMKHATGTAKQKVYALLMQPQQEEFPFNLHVNALKYVDSKRERVRRLFIDPNARPLYKREITEYGISSGYYPICEYHRYLTDMEVLCHSDDLTNIERAIGTESDLLWLKCMEILGTTRAYFNLHGQPQSQLGAGNNSHFCTDVGEVDAQWFCGPVVIPEDEDGVMLLGEPPMRFKVGIPQSVMTESHGFTRDFHNLHGDQFPGFNTRNGDLSMRRKEYDDWCVCWDMIVRKVDILNYVTYRNTNGDPIDEDVLMRIMQIYNDFEERKFSLYDADLDPEELAPWQRANLEKSQTPSALLRFVSFSGRNRFYRQSDATRICVFDMITRGTHTAFGQRYGVGTVYKWYQAKTTDIAPPVRVKILNAVTPSETVIDQKFEWYDWGGVDPLSYSERNDGQQAYDMFEFYPNNDQQRMQELEPEYIHPNHLECTRSFHTFSRDIKSQHGRWFNDLTGQDGNILHQHKRHFSLLIDAEQTYELRNPGSEIVAGTWRPARPQVGNKYAVLNPKTIKIKAQERALRMFEQVSRNRSNDFYPIYEEKYGICWDVDEADLRKRAESGRFMLSGDNLPSQIARATTLLKPDHVLHLVPEDLRHKVEIEPNGFLRTTYTPSPTHTDASWYRFRKEFCYDEHKYEDGHEAAYQEYLFGFHQISQDKEIFAHIRERYEKPVEDEPFVPRNLDYHSDTETASESEEEGDTQAVQREEDNGNLNMLYDAAKVFGAVTVATAATIAGLTI